MYNASKFAGAMAILGLAAAAWFSVLLARADFEFRKGTGEGVARAIELAPRNTAYLSFRATQVEYDGGDSRLLLEEIAKTTPDASSPRIRLGLDAELRGDTAGAERWLLDAARVDHQHEPRWTLANFYFRQQRFEEFWKWMRSALEVSYGDRSPAFDLCIRVNPDPRAILARAIPDNHDVVATFLIYLLRSGGTDGAPVAERLLQWHDPEDLPVLSQEMDILLRNGHRLEAQQIWMDLGYPDAVGGVVNPDFGGPRIGHGFDWLLVPNPGITETQLDAPPALKISFNGMQPESCELLRQYTGVRSGKRYLLRWESRGIGNGIAWRIGAEQAPLRASADWMPDQQGFVATQDQGPLALVYSRPLGEVRVEGSIELRHVALEEQ